MDVYEETGIEGNEKEEEHHQQNQLNQQNQQGQQGQQEVEEEEEEEVVTYTTYSEFSLAISTFFEQLLEIIVSRISDFPSIRDLIEILSILTPDDFINFSNSTKDENFCFVSFLVSRNIKMDPIFIDTILRLNFHNVWIFVEDGIVEYDVPIEFKSYGDKLLQYLRKY
ncbi:hypothetical protein CYY_002124 [Polysphondylium violaceum]|uniref:Uncharacterized protein n=1 Tax=Polysphondylium violaceum TaxID=133409 RepID=A0A8J4V370_9MYCE|nr:hypothetical protein CYY_002124 [Polysphondylium violaceum]